MCPRARPAHLSTTKACARARGAAGFWVEGGQIAYPVHEVTIAGNLREMFRDITAIGADVYTQGSKAVGSVLVRRMKLAGS